MAKAVGRPRQQSRYRTELRLDPALADKLQRVAANESRSMNAQIEYYIRCGIEEYERKHGKIETQEES